MPTEHERVREALRDSQRLMAEIRANSVPAQLKAYSQAMRVARAYRQMTKGPISLNAYRAMRGRPRNDR